MPTQDAILTVILVAIVANLLVAVALLVSPRFRTWRHAGRQSPEVTERMLQRAQALAGPVGTPAEAGAPADVVEELAHSNGSLLMLERSSAGQGPGTEPGELEIDSREAAVESDTAGPADDSPRPEHDVSDSGLTDALTGFDLPATWSKRLTEENARVQRYGRAATVVLVELAGLDRLAERLGPAAAERLIPPIATTMRRHARSADSLARLGPTRFAALMPDTDEVKAINYIERVRGACDVWLEAGAVSLRLSIGWAEINANQTVDPAVQAAEGRLNIERQRLRVRDGRDSDEGRDIAQGQMRAAPAN